MEQITQKFNDIVNTNIRPENKYIVATISILLALYAAAYAPKLPEFIVKLLDNVLVKILLIFFLLYINLNYQPSVSIVVAIFLVILMLALNVIKRDREHMASIMGTGMEGVPPYVYSICGHPNHPCDQGACREGECKLGEHGERMYSDGPISGVSEAEVVSLCGHLKDKNATGDIITGANFSELVNTQESCDFARHQYDMDFPSVKCASATDISGNDEVFPTPAPVQTH